MEQKTTNAAERKRTNYERIKSMSLDEMHKFLIKLNSRRACTGLFMELPDRAHLSYNDEIKIWLESEDNIDDLQL